MDAIAVLVATAILLLVLYMWGSRNKNLPPGPPGLPLLGNIMALRNSQDMFGYVEKQRKKYGQVFTMWFATVPGICISGYKNVYETLVTNSAVTSGRPKLLVLNEMSGGHGILFQDGEPWKQMRRFTLTALRDLGFGKRGTEEKIIEEVGFVVAEIDKFAGKSWKAPKVLFNMATSNVICSLIFKTRFAYTDVVFIDLLQKLNDGVQAADSMSIFDLMPVAMSVFRPRFIESPIMGFAKAARALAREQIEMHRKTYDANDIRDFVDYYLKVKEEGSDRVTEEDMFAAINDMFLAGTETSATTLDWAILFMMENPDIQARCQKEIDTQVGKNRVIRMEDKKALPFVEATMLEVMRHATILPNSVIHRATEAFKFRGYDIPKDAIILVNLYSALHDPDYWTDPDVFNPNRFMSADGTIIKHASFIPFSTGPRVCLGETLARTEVFVFLANVLQNFSFTRVAGDKEDYLSHHNCPNLVRSAMTYQTRVTRRE